MTLAGTAGHLAEMAVMKEATAGTTPAISATTTFRDYFTDDPGINAVQNVIKLGNIQKRHNVGHVLSAYHMEGSIPQIVTPQGDLGLFLVCALGTDTSAQLGGTTAYSHTYANNDDLKTFSLWYKRGGNQQIAIPYGVVNTLELTQSVDDVLRMSVGFIGQKETINADAFGSMEDYDIVEPFHNMDLTVTGPTNATQVHNTTISINNNFDITNGRVHGSRFYNSMIPGKRDITGSFDVWFDDDGDYQSFWGSTTDTTPDINGVFDTIPLLFTWDTNVEADTGYNYTLVVDIPEAVYETTTVTIGDRIKQTVNWSAQYDTGDSYEVNVVLTNNYAVDY